MMSLTREDVLKALEGVNDPELHKSLTELGMVDNIVISDDLIALDIILTTKACPLKEKIRQDAKAAVDAIANGIKVHVNISGKTLSPRLPEKKAIPGIKNIIAISSGKGGVGKSTTAVNIACAMAKAGAKVGILDADIYGPNVPIMMGVEGQTLKGVDKNNKAILPEGHGVKVMSISFLVKPDQAMIWRGPILHKSLAQFFTDMAWGELDYLLIDLPPGTGDAQLSISQLAPITGGIIVTTPQDVSLADCRRANSMFKQTNIPVLGVIENMSYFINSHGERENIFGEGGGDVFSKELGLELLAEVPLVPQVRKDADAGLPIVISNPESIPAQLFSEASHKIVAKICEMAVDSYGAELPEPVAAV